MAGAFTTAVKLLETYRGRDKIIRTAGFSACFASGLASKNEELSKKLLTITSELNACRTILRLFDDLSMLAFSLHYGFGKEEKDSIQRVFNLLSNAINQIFFPIEHIAWAADKGLISVSSAPWWFASLLTWITSLCINILRSIWKLAIIKKKESYAAKKSDSKAFSPQMRVAKRLEYLSLLESLSNLGMAIHWLPGNRLWSGKLNNTALGALGILSSVIGLVKMGMA